VTGLSRASLLSSARVFALRQAIVAHLAPLFADIPVVPHPGKLDISDVLAKATFTTPCVAVAATNMKLDGRLSGADDFVVSLAAYVIAAPDMVDGARVEGEEMALAICQAILSALSDDDFASWELSDIGLPADAEGKPLFTVKNVEEGAVYYVVTWKQTLYQVTAPVFGKRYDDEDEL
jgi:hypothetical protein